MSGIFKFRATVCACAALLCLTGIHASAVAQPLSNQLVVLFDEAANPEGLVHAFGDSIIGEIANLKVYLVAFDRFANVEEAVAFYQGLIEYVDFAQPNYRLTIPQLDQISHAFLDPYSEPYDEGVSPDDYYTQPAGPQVQLSVAQQITKGAGTLIGVVDNGVDAGHLLFTGRLHPDDIDVWDHDLDASPDSGVVASHGTFVAGTIVFTAPEATILPIRAFDGDGSGSVFSAAEGIDYAVSQGVNVLNLSFGMPDRDSLLSLALQHASDSGITIVASAGNDGLLEPAQFPASDSRTVAVAAVDNSDILASFSNYGPEVDVCAPGVDLYGPLNGEDVWGRWQGTSFAAGFASGLAAMLLSQYPDASTEWIKWAMMDGCDNIDALNPDYGGYLGSGRLNLAATLSLSGPDACNCLIWGDVNHDSAVDPVDVTEMANYIFKGWSFSEDCPAGWNCPYQKGDIDCSGGSPTPLDLAFFVQYVFKSSDFWPCSGCN